MGNSVRGLVRSGQGGAIFATNTTIEAAYTFFINNTAGALVVENPRGGEKHAYRQLSLQGCLPLPSPPPRSQPLNHHRLLPATGILLRQHVCC